MGSSRGTIKIPRHQSASSSFLHPLGSWATRLTKSSSCSWQRETDRRWSSYNPIASTFMPKQEALMPLDDLLADLEKRGVAIDPKRLVQGRIDGILYGIPHPSQESFLVAPVVSRHTGHGKELLLWIAEELYRSSQADDPSEAEGLS